MKDEKEYYHLEDFLEDPSFVAWVDQTDPEVATFWNDWVHTHPEKKELLESAIAIVRGIRFMPQYESANKVRRELDRLNRRIDEREQLNSQPVIRKHAWYRRPPMLRMLAGIAFLLLSGIFAYQFFQLSPVHYVTDYGERMEVKLPDGTLFTLNANSSLYYERTNPRKIWLDGEAFFKVAKKVESGGKFQVITADLVVEVYGTEFNVNSRKKQTQVVLEEGKVKLALKNGEEKEMEPGDLFTYSASQNKILEETRLDRLETLTSWKDGTLIFENISMREAMDKIGELYGLEVVFENSEIAGERMFLAVPTDNIEICIKAIERSAPIPIQINMDGNLLNVSRPVN